MGQPAALLGDGTSGHGGPFPPTVITSGSSDVLVNGKPVACVGDTIAPHTRGAKPYDTHGSVVSSGSGTVLVNGKPVARIGDSIACGGTIVSGSGDVLIG